MNGPTQTMTCTGVMTLKTCLTTGKVTNHSEEWTLEGATRAECGEVRVALRVVKVIEATHVLKVLA